MAGNTPWQAGPADVAGITIPGPINFYTGDTPVAQQTYTALGASTTNVTSYINAVHATLSTLVVSLKATGIVTNA